MGGIRKIQKSTNNNDSSDGGMQLVHFRNFLLAGAAAAMFGGAGVEFILRIVKALCINTTTQNLCKAFAPNSRAIG